MSVLGLYRKHRFDVFTGFCLQYSKFKLMKVLKIVSYLRCRNLNNIIIPSDTQILHTRTNLFSP